MRPFGCGQFTREFLPGIAPTAILWLTRMLALPSQISSIITRMLS